MYFISFLNRLNRSSKYIFLAAGTVCFNIVLYVFRLMLIISKFLDVSILIVYTIYLDIILILEFLV